MHTFETAVVWRGGREGRLSAPGKPLLPVATPPEFGGPAGVWAPEELFVASVGSCLMSTFVYFAERFKIDFASYASTSKGTMEKTAQGLRFTGIDVAIAVTVPDDDVVRKASSLRLKEKLEKYCPVSTSVSFPVRVVLEIRPRAARHGEDPGEGGGRRGPESPVGATRDVKDRREPS